MLCGTVFADNIKATLTGTNMVVSGVSTTSYSDYLTTGLTDDKGNVYYGRWCHQKSGSNYMNMLQIKKTESNTATRINLPKYPGNLKKITLTVTNASSTSTTDGTGAKTRLAIINSTTYNTATATNTDNQVLVAGSSSDENTSYVFDFTTLEESYDGEGLYLCSLDGAARIWSLEAEYATAATPDPTPAPAPYAVDFNTSITTSAHDFVVASNWGHIVDFLEYDYYGSEYSYVSYGYSSTGGKNETGALYAYSQNLSASYGVSASKTAYDLLVTPLIKGQISIDVKAMDYADASLQVYALTNNGKEKGDLIKEFVLSDLSKDEYTTVTFTLAEEQKVGLRLNRVYVDNFSAESATIVPEPKLTITSVKKATDDSTVYYKQQADGSLLVQMYVKLQNNGEVDFVAGTTENYTLSVIQDYYGTKAGPFGAFAIPVNLAKGETSDDILVSVNVPAESVASLRTWGNWYVIENITSTQSSNYVYASWTAYEPKFVFRLAESSSTSSISSAESWGTITESTTKNFEIANTGTAPLTIKSITLPEGFTCSNMPEIPTEGLVIASNASQALTITQPATAYGTYAGNLTIVYLDKTGAEQTYTLAFSASYINPNTWTADFNNTTSTVKYPAGVIAEGGIDKDYQYISSGNYNNWIIGRTTSSYASGSNKFITPKLHAAAGDKLTFDVKGAYGDSYYAKVYVSTDRKTWGDSVAYFTYGEKEGAEAIGSSEWKTRTITFAEAGDYYVAFALYGKFAIDNIVGLEKVNVAHDLYIKEVSWPSAKEKSGTALSKPSVDIIPLTDEAADAYTVKYIYGENVVNINSKALTASASSTTSFSASFTPTVETTTTFPGTKVVFEFTDGTKFETEPFDLTITNEATFHFLDSKPSSKWYEPTDRTAPIAFGKLNAAATPQNFVIFNWGSADLTVNSISLPEGFTTETEFPFTVAAFNGENSGIDASSKALSINFTGTAAGTYSGNMVITYSGDKTFSLPISATMLDVTKFYANFDDGGWPAGSVYQSNISSSNGGTYSAPNYYITSSSTTNNIFVTPKLTAAAGDKLMFDAKLYNSSWSEGKVVVYAAATREEVLNAEEGTTRDSLFAVSGQDETNPMTTDYQTYEVTVPAAGDYFFGFQISGRPYVDEIYGLKAAAVAHDWMVASSNVPAEAMQNVASTATVNILNLGLAEEAADSYTVTAYVDGKAAGTGTAIALPTKNKFSDAGTQISVNFKSPKAGTFPVYIEVKAGDYSVKTAPVDVVFAEEVAKSDADMATNGTTGDVPVYLNYKNSESVTMYNAEALAAAGLSAGSKIKKITYKGYKTSDEQTTSFQVYYKWTDDQTLAQPATDYPYAATDNGMTKLIDEDYTWAKVGSSSEMEDMIVLDFTANPLTYEAGKSLVIYMHSYVDGYKAAYFEKSTLSSDFCYTRKKDAATLSDAFGKITPAAIHFTLEATTTTISGTVKNTEGAAVEGATVTLISTDGDDIQYTGTTDAEGAYSINVIQAARTYNAVASADGYLKSYAENISFGEGNQTKNFVMKQFNIATAIANADFEGEVSVYSNPKNDRAIYQPVGWTVAYNNGEENDMTALNSSSLAWNNFSGRPQLAEGGNNTYWVRFRWGSSENLTLSQKVALPAGEYRLTADAFFNGANGASANISVAGVSKNISGNGAWSNYSLDFTLTEETLATLAFNVKQTSAVENVAAFDNFKLVYLADVVKVDLQTEIAAAEALKTEARTEGVREFNAAIEAAKALLTSTVVADISAGVEALKAAETVFLTANLPVAEGTYYVYNPLTQKFLSRGNAYGTAAVVDDYGVAVNVTVTDLTTASYKLSSFDNGAAYGFDAWMYADAGGNNVRTYNINKVEGGVTLTNTTNNQLVYVYLNDGADKFRVAGNAIKDDNYTDDAQAVWQLLTKAERDEIVAAHEAAQKTAAFAAADVLGNAELTFDEATTLTFATGHTWTQTVVRSEKNQPATNDNGTEMWQATGNYTQTIKNVPTGLYKISIQAFYRNGGADECVARYNTGYNTVLAYLEANGNKVQVKSWAADKGEGTNPNSMGEAKAKFDEGKYLSEVYTFVGEDSVLNLTVNNPAHIGNGWFIVGNVKYAKANEVLIAGDANRDGEVTTSDAVAAVNFALEKEVPSEKAFKAADVNKSNSITVSDAVGIVNIALGKPAGDEAATARGEKAEAVNYLTMNGASLNLMNSIEFVGFQMDVTLADGAQFNGVQLADRAADLQVIYNRISANTYRIIAFSTGNAAIEGNEGELFTLDIAGNHNINITNIEFADAAANAYAIGFAETTGINGIFAGAANVESYTVGGVKNDKVRKGMNIVRTADGKVKKVFVK